jgi:hypothetical protein
VSALQLSEDLAWSLYRFCREVMGTNCTRAPNFGSKRQEWANAMISLSGLNASRTAVSSTQLSRTTTAGVNQIQHVRRIQQGGISDLDPGISEGTRECPSSGGRAYLGPRDPDQRHHRVRNFSLQGGQSLELETFHIFSNRKGRSAAYFGQRSDIFRGESARV